MYDLIADYNIGEDSRHTRTRKGEAQLEYSNAWPQCIETVASVLFFFFAPYASFPIVVVGVVKI